MLLKQLALLYFPVFIHAQTYSVTYTPDNIPKKTQEGQTGTNQCGSGSSQDSSCQNAYINSVDDFCLFAPPKSGHDSSIGNTERIEVSWCTKSGYGTRLIPEGAITGAHFVQTPDYVQVTGVGDLTLLNIPKGDSGGELDPHGADGNGNPVGSLVFSSVFGETQQIHEWTNFLSWDQFCFRACKPQDSAPEWCQHKYDLMGCHWNMPGNYDAGVFEKCKADSGQMMGIYDGSTWKQGMPQTPAAHPAPSSSLCTTVQSIRDFAVQPSGVSGSTTSSVATSTSSLTLSNTAPLTSRTSDGQSGNTLGSKSSGSVGRADMENSQRVMVIAISVVLGALMVF
ncbi:hypothetical protein BDW22DRAFT_1433510 [Trametopsis cervina]|nr:hypothetical protein BDW22DRAFT_1433510 [Trametopsis cervina]